VGQLEAALSLRRGAGEGPLLVPKELAFYEFARQRRTIDFDQGPSGPWAPVVDRAGDQLFARAGLTQDEHRRVRGGYSVQVAHHLLETRVLSDHLGEIVLGADLILKITILSLQPVLESLDLAQRALQGGIGLGQRGRSLGHPLLELLVQLL